jgi:hypothetical protein
MGQRQGLAFLADAVVQLCSTRTALKRQKSSWGAKNFLLVGFCTKDVLFLGSCQRLGGFQEIMCGGEEWRDRTWFEGWASHFL